MPKRTLQLPFPINLRVLLQAVKGSRIGGRSGLPPGAWWPTRTPEGPATLHLTASNGQVAAEAWGPGAQWALDQAPRLLGVEDEPSGFRPHHPVIAELARRSGGMRFGRTDRFFEAMLPTILAQKVTSKEAGRSYRQVLSRYGEPAPGPARLRLLPAPETLAALPYYDLHPLGVEQKRSRTLIGVAKRVGRIEEAGSMSRENAYRRLNAFPGIGPWTAANVMAVAAGDTDAVPVGDYHVPNLVSWALAGEPRGDDDRMLELLEPYRGHRGRVVRMLKFSGISAPAYGPRMPVREFADH